MRTQITPVTTSTAAPVLLAAALPHSHRRIAFARRRPGVILRWFPLGLSFAGLFLALFAAGCASTKPSSSKATLVPANTAPNVFSAPLYAAAERGDLQELKELLRGGLDPNGANRQGWTPLNAAVGRDGGLETNRVTQLLAEAGARPNVIPKNPTLTGRTCAVLAKHKAAQGEHRLAIEYYKSAIAKLEEAAKPQKSRRTASFLRSMLTPDLNASYGSGRSYTSGGINQNVMGMFDALSTGGRGGAHYSQDYSEASRTVKQYRGWIEECRKAVRALESTIKPA